MSLSEDMEAINRYFMEQVKVQTPAAEKVKQEWMKWWADNSGDLWYSEAQFDVARNLKKKFDLANAKSNTEREQIKEIHARGITAEELRGETRRSGTDGMFLEEEKPLIPTSWKVTAGIGAGLFFVGMFAKKLFANTPLGRLTKLL